jgi:hypothetical protein
MYGLDVFYLLAFAVAERPAELESAYQFSPFRIKILVVEETLPITLKLGSRAYCDLTQTGYVSVHFLPDDHLILSSQTF